MLAKVLEPADSDLANQAWFCSRRRSARRLRWAGSSAGMEVAQSVDQGVEVKKGARGSRLEA